MNKLSFSAILTVLAVMALSFTACAPEPEAAMPAAPAAPDPSCSLSLQPPNNRTRASPTIVALMENQYSMVCFHEHVCSPTCQGVLPRRSVAWRWGFGIASMRCCVAHEGRILLIGFASGSWGPVDPAHLVYQNYSVVGVIADAGMYAFRDPFGIKPIILGKRETDEGTFYAVASESVATRAPSL